MMFPILHDFVETLFHHFLVILLTIVFQIPPEVRRLDGMFFGVQSYLLTFGVWKPRVMIPQVMLPPAVRLFP